MKHRAITSTLEHMRNCYTAPTNEALIALAVRLQWVALAIDTLDHPMHRDLGVP